MPPDNPLAGFPFAGQGGNNTHMQQEAIDDDRFLATQRTVIIVLGRALSLGERTARLNAETRLLGGIPEFDSMAVVAVITALEEELGIVVDDDEIAAETFETVGSLARFVHGKL